MREAFLRAAGLICVMACGVAAQEIAPDVLLARIKLHLRDELTRLPNYTCLETINRFHKDAARGSKFQPLDTVQLEIVYSGGREWYGSPGDRSIGGSDLSSFVAAGMIANGIFGITLHNLFVADAAYFTFKGASSLDGRPAIQFDYRFPHTVMEVTIPEGNGSVAEEGSIWVDPESLDLLRLDVHATQIPAYLPLAGLEFTVNYARTRIGEYDALMAQQADLQMRLESGKEDYDRLNFTHCRMFHTYSAIHFDAEPFDPAKAPEAIPRRTVPPSEPETHVPALLAVTVELTTPVTDRDAVGKLIAGRVVGDVLRKGKVVVENGAVVRGRIRRLDRYQKGGQFIVGLEFTEVEALGAPLRFYADLLKLEKRKGIEPARREVVLLPGSGPTTTEIVLPELPGIASFFVEGKTFTLPAGFRTTWRTRGILHGVNR